MFQKTFLRQQTLLCFAGALLVILLSCATSAPVAIYQPVFDYSPPKHENTMSAGVTFAVAGADFSSPVMVFTEFSRQMAQDFYEIMISRGFTTRGPFRNYDEITFPDKKGSDLLLVPEIEINAQSQLRWAQTLGGALFGKTDLVGEGTISISGRVNIKISESLSNEIMWVKSVGIDVISIPVKTAQTYPVQVDNINLLLEKEPAIQAEIAKALESVYMTVLGKVYTYLDPEEMRMLKKQSEEIRQKKVY